MKSNETIDAAEIQTMHRRIANLEQQVARQRKSITDLVEREENYRAIFDAANEAMVILDRRSGKIVDFTASAVELYGTDGKHFRDLDAGELFGGESPAAGRNAVQLLETASGEEAFIFECRPRRPSGQYFWIEVTLKRCVISHVGRIIALIRDITERKKAEEALRRSEDRYRTVFENTGTATFVNEADMTLSMVNSGFEKLTGYTKNEIEGRMHWTDFVHPDDHERLKGYHVKRRSNGIAPNEFECRLVDRAGNVKDMFLQVDLVPGTKKSIGSFTDITNLKRTEKALQETSAKLKAIINSFEGLIYVSSAQYRIEFINDRYRRLLGKDVTGALCYEALHNRETVCPFCVQAQVQEGQTVKFELKNPLDRRWYHSINSPIQRADGSSSLLALITDIHQRKIDEVELRESEDTLRKENTLLRSCIKERYRFGEIVGKSRPMQEVYETIVKAAATDASVIIYGESGTGKELVARAIHEMSDRKQQRFISVNCGAIPEKLLESEFFGYKKGAFTGAVADKKGYLDLAHEGTLFLDELGEIDLNLQVKLLRVIEGKGYMPVGGTEERTSRTRILAATNRNLKELVRSGRMREDFYYRVNVVPLVLPPLRSRKEDLPLLIDHFLKIHGNGDAPPITGKIFDALYDYDWPGNVRELENVILRYISMKEFDYQSVLPAEGGTGGMALEDASQIAPRDLRTMVEDLEKRAIAATLHKYRWHKSKAASVLGIDRKTLAKKIEAYRLTQD